jgi:hypothetical protein
MVTIAPPDPANAGVGFLQGIQQTLPQQLGQFLEKRKENREIDALQKQLEGLSPDASLTDRLQAIMSSKASEGTKQKYMELMKLQGATQFAQKFREGKDIGEADLIEGLALGYIPPGFAQEKIRELQSKKLFEQFFGEGEESPNRPTPYEPNVELTGQPVSTLSEPPPPSVPKVTKSGKGWEKYNDSDLTLMKAAGGPLGTAADLELKRREKARELEFKNLKEDEDKRQFGHKQTATYAEELRKSSENAREVQQAVNEIVKLSKEGKTGPTLKNAFTKFLQSRGSFLAPAFVNKDTQSVISATKTLAGGFRELFGSRPTQAEFFWYENILPDLLKDADTNIAAAEYLGKVADHKLRAQDIADDIVTKNGGYRPIDLDTKVRQRMKGDLDKLIKEGEALHKAPKQEEAPERQAFDELPPPAQFKGKTITNQETGVKMYSDGTKWTRIQQ